MDGRRTDAEKQLDRLWPEMIGPAHDEAAVATIMDLTVDQVREHPGLLRLEMRTKGIAYPALQFGPAMVLPGIQEVMAVLGPAVATPWTIASWLATDHDLLGRSPVEALRAVKVDDVVAAALSFASALSR